MKYKVGTVIEFSSGLEGIGEIVETESGSKNKNYLVKLLGKNAGKGHNGNGFSKKQYETDDYWFVREPQVLSVVESEEIYITRKGNTVHTVMINGGQVVGRAKAICSPEDEFDFQIGASLALERLFPKKPEETEPDEPELVEIVENPGSFHFFEAGDVCKVVDRNDPYVHVEKIQSGESQVVSKDDIIPIKPVKRTAKAGEYIMIVSNNVFTHNMIGDVLKVNRYNGHCAEVLPKDHPKERNVRSSAKSDGHWNYCNDEYVVLEGYKPPKKFVPHLEGMFGNYGTIGEETPMKDVTGKTLYVGDTVLTIDKQSGYVNDYHHYIVKRGLKYFVMGVEACCQKSGEIDKYLVVKKKSYKDLTNGLEYMGIKAVLKEE